MIVRLKRKVPGPPSSLREYIQKRLSINRPIAPPLQPLDKARVFLNAKMAGASTIEAKALSSFGSNITQIMQQPATQAILIDIEREQKFKNQSIVNRLKEMWDHKRKRLQKIGDDVEVIEEDDTDLWKYSMDKVLALKGYTKDSDGSGPTSILEATGGVTFNVLNIKNE